MLTAKAAQESKIEGLESGAAEYLTKAFHLYEPELRIRNLLQERTVTKASTGKVASDKTCIRVTSSERCFS